MDDNEDEATAAARAKFVEWLEQFASDPNRLLNAPQTTLTALREIAPALGPLFALPEIQQELARVAEFGRALPDAYARSTDPQFVAVVDLIDQAESVAGRIAVEAILASAPHGERFFLAMIAPGSGEFARASHTHEEHLDRVCKMIARIAERLYRPLLRASLALYRLATKGPPPKKNMLLGPVMQECRHTRDPRLESITFARSLLIIRNSEAHGHTDLVGRSDAVVFINNPDKGLPQRLECTPDQLVAIYRELAALCTTMSAAMNLGTEIVVRHRRQPPAAT